MLKRTVGILAIVLGLVVVSGHAEDKTHLTAANCTSLKDFSIPASAIGLPTSGAVVTTAATSSSLAVGPSYYKPDAADDFCKVVGVVKPKNPASPNLEFEVNLPLNWNSRALQMGGGGYDGTLVTGLTAFTLQPPNTPTPLQRGYVTLGSDGGHKGGPGFDGTFGLDDEALVNYGKQSVKKTHDAAMAIIRKAYGRAPERFYFIGGSQGGHEALDAAARYPEDYDGVVANYPAYNVTMLHLGSLNVGRALYADGGTAWMDPKHRKLLTDAVYGKCDELDGVKDGIISNIAACNAAFDVKTLRCPDGAAGETCLSDAQLRAVSIINSEYKPGVTIAGASSFGKWTLLEGALFAERSSFGEIPQPGNPTSDKEPLLYKAGDQTVKFIITRNPKFDAMQFDPKKYASRIATVASIMDVTDASLEKFRAKGGKIIMTHGTADDFITPYNSIAYYKKQVAQFGQSRLDGFMKFYVIPGFAHGYGGFNAKFDGLGALQKWVENGQAPSGLVALDGNTGATAGRTRPMCEWPKWPKFTGKPGFQNSAASFTCVEK